VGACHAARRDADVRVVDLIKDLPRAERRPESASFPIVEQTLDGITHPAISIPIPARIVWTLRFPERASFRAFVALDGPPAAAVTIRAGVSDDRRYDALSQVAFAAAPSQWVPLTADLSLYAGRKWSVFYRPDAHPWRFVLSIDGAAGQAHAICAEPSIDSDRDAARKYAASGKLP
jgi:hypothetical protein